MGRVPTSNVEMEKVATPPLTVAVPICTLRLKNVTVPPSGGGPESGETMAVKVTVWPNLEGLGVQVSAVVVASEGTSIPKTRLLAPKTGRRQPRGGKV
jgi:hypothetical protein